MLLVAEEHERLPQYALLQQFGVPFEFQGETELGFFVEHGSIDLERPGFDDANSIAWIATSVFSDHCRQRMVSHGWNARHRDIALAEPRHVFQATDREGHVRHHPRGMRQKITADRG